MIASIILAVFVFATNAYATTYYVGPTGNDSTGTGSVGNPWRTIQKCFAAGSPLVAGDACEAADGTYTSASTGRVVVIGSSSPQGTVAAPITIRAANRHGAIINAPDTSVVPGTNCDTTVCLFAGIYISGRGNYIIEGFQFTRTGAGHGTLVSAHGVYLDNTTNVTLRHNHFHDIGRNVCSNTIYGQTGTYAQNSTSMLIEYNTFNTIGRLRDGENGCSTTIFGHDHSIYHVAGTNVTIRRNVFYDIDRGTKINIKATTAGTRSKDYFIYHNVMAGRWPTNSPNSVISLTNIFENIIIKNNIFYDPPGDILWWYNTSQPEGAGVIFQYNLTDLNQTEAELSAVQFRPTSGVTISNNITNTNPGFIDAANDDFRLASGSAAIGAGTAIAGYSANDSPDIGAFETFVPTAATITTTTISLTLGMNIHTPIQATSGPTGWSVACSPSCGTPLTVTAVSRKPETSSVLDITVSGWIAGQCAAGKTITVSYNATTGTVEDFSYVGGTINQTLHTITTYPVTNNCSGTPASGPPSGSYVYLHLDGNANDSSGNANHGTASGGSFVAARSGQGYQTVTGTNAYVEAPYGNAVNPSASSFTVAFSVNIPQSDVSALRTYAGTSLGTDQRFHVRTDTTWRLAVQDYNGGTASEFAVQSGWTRVCVRFNSGTDTATMYINGVAGTSSGSVRSYTSYALSNNIRFGLPNGHDAVNAGQGVYDEVLIWQSLISCEDDYTAWNALSAPWTGTISVVTARAYGAKMNHLGNKVAQANANTNFKVAKKGAFAIFFQTDCTIVDCSAIGQKLYYTCALCPSAGSELPVPDMPTTDKIAFYGMASEYGLLSGDFGALLSGALLRFPGDTNLTSASVPVFDIDKDSSIVNGYVMYLDNTTVGYTYCIYPKEQTGLALDSIAPTGGLCVEATEHGMQWR